MGSLGQDHFLWKKYCISHPWRHFYTSSYSIQSKNAWFFFSLLALCSWVSPKCSEQGLVHSIVLNTFVDHMTDANIQKTISLSSSESCQNPKSHERGPGACKNCFFLWISALGGVLGQFFRRLSGMEVYRKFIGEWLWKKYLWGSKESRTVPPTSDDSMGNSGTKMASRSCLHWRKGTKPVYTSTHLSSDIGCPLWNTWPGVRWFSSTEGNSREGLATYTCSPWRTCVSYWRWVPGSYHSICAVGFPCEFEGREIFIIWRPHTVGGYFTLGFLVAGHGNQFWLP